MSFLQRFQSSLESLSPLPGKTTYVIAYSGGVDSHVLLHCCHKLGLSIRAVHIHHGLQELADDWVIHCKNTCDDLKIPLETIYIDAAKKKGQSPEESARIARYTAIQNNLQQGDCLLTAQHLNDQAETFLLQLFRTSASAGLAAMPSSKLIGNNYHLRPFLTFSRHEIETYAEANSLQWMEDPSNKDDNFDRNFIRNNLIPLLKNRWPETVEQLATVAGLQSSSHQVQADMAAIDLANTIVMRERLTTPSKIEQNIKSWVYDVVSVLSISALNQLSTPRLLNVLRYWIKQTMDVLSVTGIVSKSSPKRKLLFEIVQSLINSQQDSNPVIVLSGYELRRYQDNLYLLKKKPSLTEHSDTFRSINWQPSLKSILPVLNRNIIATKTVGRGLKGYLLHEKLKVSFRKGGEQFHPVGRRHSQSLKKLFQEASVPPWERDAIPLLYWQDELIAVVGVWVSNHFAAGEGESGWVIEFEGL